MPYRVVVADSSEAAAADALKAASPVRTEIRRFDPSMDFYEKIIACVEAVDTEFTVMLPDDDITFVHAIKQCLDYLVAHPDTSAAWGYVVDFGIHERDFDIVRVRWFTPTIGEDDPLQRLYHLMRRYQPFFWGVFRTKTLLTALKRARDASITIFKEMTTLGTAALLGKVARLPCIYQLRGMEESMTSLSEINPFYSLIDNSDKFFTHYGHYHNQLTEFVEQNIKPISCAPDQLRHTLNLIHVICYGKELDLGTTNYTVERLLGAKHPPHKSDPQWIGWRDIDRTDLVTVLPEKRRCVWRKRVLDAEPRDEIAITKDERKRIETALQYYHLS